MVNRIRKFEGQVYILTANTRYGTLFDDASLKAERLRRQGFKVRIVKVGDEYYNYARLRKRAIRGGR